LNSPGEHCSWTVNADSLIRSKNSSTKSLICRAIEGSFINLLFLYDAQKF